jgi:hypothetical protein
MTQVAPESLMILYPTFNLKVLKLRNLLRLREITAIASESNRFWLIFNRVFLKIIWYVNAT